MKNGSLYVDKQLHFLFTMNGILLKRTFYEKFDTWINLSKSLFEICSNNGGFFLVRLGQDDRRYPFFFEAKTVKDLWVDIWNVKMLIITLHLWNISLTVKDLWVDIWNVKMLIIALHLWNISFTVKDLWVDIWNVKMFIITLRMWNIGLTVKDLWVDI
jgi:hypothetical protein